MNSKQQNTNRKFIFLYLNTGNGHISSARVIKKSMAEVAPDVPVELVNGFDEHNYLGHFFFEKCYALACNYLHGAFPLIYDLGQHRFFLSLFNGVLQYRTRRTIRNAIIQYQATDVVSFHFALSPAAQGAIRDVDPKIKFTEICTDPFTGPHAWFYKRNQDTLVESEDMKQMAIRECQVPAKNLKVMPFIIDKKYEKPITQDEIVALRKQYGFDEKKRIVLLAGGGEGLPGALKIINQCVLHKADFAIAVVCGRNKEMKMSLDILAKTYSGLDLHVYGFVDFMESLIKMSDLVVSKAGPATVLEIISCHKPIIISSYIHNQELGNMKFTVKNHVGYFIQSSTDIYKKIDEIFKSDESYKKVASKFNGVAIDIDTTKTARYLLEK